MNTKHKAAAIFSLFLISLLFIGAGTKSKPLMVTFHLEGEQSDTDKFVSPVKLGSERKQYYFRKVPSFTDKDFVWFYPFRSQDGQSMGAAFRLSNLKTQELVAVTAKNPGKLFGTRVLDAPLRAVVIDRTITDGVIVVWDGLSQNHIKLLATQIPHSDQYQQGNIPTVPSFGTDQPATTSTEAPATTTPDRKKPFKLFGNFKKGNTTTPESGANPYANPPIPR